MQQRLALGETPRAEFGAPLVSNWWRACLLRPARGMSLRIPVKADIFTFCSISSGETRAAFVLSRQGSRFRFTVIPRAPRHPIVAEQTRDRVQICRVAVADLHHQRKRFAFIAATSRCITCSR